MTVAVPTKKIEPPEKSAATPSGEFKRSSVFFGKIVPSCFYNAPSKIQAGSRLKSPSRLESYFHAQAQSLRLKARWVCHSASRNLNNFLSSGL
jgi:hypothetical protein